MHERLREIHAACLPFVTRSLRGSARRRVTAGSFLLVLAVVVLGVWVAKSPGWTAHGLRVDLGLEQSRWDRENLEFTIFATDEHERRAIMGADPERAIARSGPMRFRAEEAWSLLDVAADPLMEAPRSERDLQAQARALRDARRDLAPADLHRRGSQAFNWWSLDDRQRLQAVIDAGLVPKVVVYASPLDAAATIRLVGALAGGLLVLLLTVVAPLWSGVQLAQELHENTLQPLTGTALTSRQLVLGMAIGPLAPIGIVGVPLLATTLAAALLAGRVAPALGFVAMGSLMGAMLVGLAMLIALGIGRQRAPGIVGIGLLGLLGSAAFAGIVAGMHISRDVIGVVDVVPGAGPIHLLSEAFLPRAFLTADEAVILDVWLALASVGAAVLAAITLRALERCVGGTHHEGALRSSEGIVAALMLGLLAVVAIPLDASFGEALLAALALAITPLQLVLMGRVPGGDVPPSLRRVPVARLLGEHGLWLAIVLGLTVVLHGLPEEVPSGTVIGVLHIGWALNVAALVTLRFIARPTSILAKLWLVGCLFLVVLEYVNGVMLCLETQDPEVIVLLGAASPVLGLLQLGLFFWTPISLLQGLGAAPPSTVGSPDRE